MKVPQCHIFAGLPPDPIEECPEDCRYRTKSGNIISCDYILAHYRKRGCRGGKECTAYEKAAGKDRD